MKSREAEERPIQKLSEHTKEQRAQVFLCVSWHFFYVATDNKTHTQLNRKSTNILAPNSRRILRIVQTQ